MAANNFILSFVKNLKDDIYEYADHASLEFHLEKNLGSPGIVLGLSQREWAPWWDPHVESTPFERVRNTAPELSKNNYHPSNSSHLQPPSIEYISSPSQSQPSDLQESDLP